MSRIFQLPRQVPLVSGAVSPGAKANFFLTGTTTRTNSFTDSALGTPHANPVIANAAGEFATIYLDPDVVYKLTLDDTNDALIYTEDPVQDALTQANIGKILYPRTAAEITAGITPTDFSFLAGNVRRYGTVADGNGGGGGTNDAAALQNALNSGHKLIWAPDGTYRCDTSLTVPDGVTFKGYGSSVTIIDGTNVSAPDSGTQKGVLESVGAGLTSLGAPNTNPVILGRTLSFASAPSVAVRDVLIIHNATDFSWQGDRDIYREGEFCQVRDLSSSTINLVSSLYSGYTAANVLVHKVSGVTGAIKQMKVIAPPSNDTSAIRIKHGINYTLTSLDLVGSDFTEILIDQCYNMQIDKIYAAHLQTAAGSVDYAIDVSNSQHIRITDSHLIGRRHAVTYSAKDATGGVPCRDVRTEHCILITTGTDITAANFHGNTEFCSYNDCAIDGGLDIAGDHNNVSDCIIRNGGLNGSVVRFSEMKGWNHTFDNVELYSNGGSAAAAGAAIDLGGISADADSNTDRGGTLTFRKIKIVDDTASTTADDLITIRNRGSAQTYDVIFDGIEIAVTDVTLGTLFMDTVSGNSPRRIVIHDFDVDRGNIDINNAGNVDLFNVDIDTAKTSKDAINLAITVNDSLVRADNSSVLYQHRSNDIPSYKP